MLGSRGVSWLVQLSPLQPLPLLCLLLQTSLGGDGREFQSVYSSILQNERPAIADSRGFCRIDSIEGIGRRFRVPSRSKSPMRMIIAPATGLAG